MGRIWPERGAYEPGEVRPRLFNRDVKQWTPMEREVFNVVTHHWDRAPSQPPFSKRVRIVEAMLTACDAETWVQPWL